MNRLQYRALDPALPLLARYSFEVALLNTGSTFFNTSCECRAFLFGFVVLFVDYLYQLALFAALDQIAAPILTFARYPDPFVSIRKSCDGWLCWWKRESRLGESKGQFDW